MLARPGVFFRFSNMETVKEETCLSDNMEDDSEDPCAGDAWRTLLCPRGPHCRDPDYSHAHRLCDLRPPMETQRLHLEIWEAGIDRFYGQQMTEESMKIVMEYHDKTLDYETPQWAHALVFSVNGQNTIRDLHFPWDYGLTMDVLMLSVRRGGQRPFEWLPGLWEVLHGRERELSKEQDDP